MILYAPWYNWETQGLEFLHKMNSYVSIWNLHQPLQLLDNHSSIFTREALKITTSFWFSVSQIRHIYHHIYVNLKVPKTMKIISVFLVDYQKLSYDIEVLFSSNLILWAHVTTTTDSLTIISNHCLLFASFPKLTYYRWFHPIKAV